MISVSTSSRMRSQRPCTWRKTQPISPASTSLASQQRSSDALRTARTQTSHRVSTLTSSIKRQHANTLKPNTAFQTPLTRQARGCIELPLAELTYPNYSTLCGRQSVSQQFVSIRVKPARDLTQDDLSNRHDDACSRCRWRKSDADSRCSSDGRHSSPLQPRNVILRLLE